MIRDRDLLLSLTCTGVGISLAMSVEHRTCGGPSAKEAGRVESLADWVFNGGPATDVEWVSGVKGRTHHF